MIPLSSLEIKILEIPSKWFPDSHSNDSHLNDSHSLGVYIKIKIRRNDNRVKSCPAHRIDLGNPLHVTRSSH